MTERLTRENQIVTYQAVNQYKGKGTFTATGVTVTRIGVRKDGVTYGTCKFNGLAHAVILTEGNRWTVNG